MNFDYIPEIDDAVAEYGRAYCNYIIQLEPHWYKYGETCDIGKRLKKHWSDFGEFECIVHIFRARASDGDNANHVRDVEDLIRAEAKDRHENRTYPTRKGRQTEIIHTRNINHYIKLVRAYEFNACASSSSDSLDDFIDEDDEMNIADDDAEYDVEPSCDSPCREHSRSYSRSHSRSSHRSHHRHASVARSVSPSIGKWIRRYPPAGREEFQYYSDYLDRTGERISERRFREKMNNHGYVVVRGYWSAE
jgi:hypothetical protein